MFNEFATTPGGYLPKRNGFSKQDFILLSGSRAEKFSFAWCIDILIFIVILRDYTIFFFNKRKGVFEAVVLFLFCIYFLHLACFVSKYHLFSFFSHFKGCLPMFTAMKIFLHTPLHYQIWISTCL